MAKPRRVSRQQVREMPYIVWNEFVDLLAMSELGTLTRMQRVAHLAFCYYSEVENGGHMQYFENRGTAHTKETIESLKKMGAHCHAKVLAGALNLFNSKVRRRIETVEEYVAKALEEEFEVYDNAYHRCKPSMDESFESFLEKNQTDFVVVVD